MLWLLFACDSFEPTWIDQRPACSAEPYSWSDDILSYVASGDGDGTFSLDPVDEPRTAIEGAYDPYGGTFAYEVEYAEGYWLVSRIVEEGVGTVWHTGDLDVEFTTTTVDVLGVEAASGERIIREGCKQTEFRWDPTVEEPVYERFDGAYTAGVYKWEADVQDAEWSGTRSEDGTRTQDYRSDGVTLSTVENPDGTSDEDFLYETNDYDYEGADHRGFDGSLSRRYDIREDGDTICEVEEERDYSGAGTATYECDDGDFECEYTVSADGDCRYTCDDGQRGSC